MAENNKIDGGKPFDWSRASSDYAKYRDIYPADFYREIIHMGLCTSGQQVLDIGTGTGVLPRNLYRYGAHFIGLDSSEGQIEQAKKLSAEEGMDIAYFCKPAEKGGFADETFDTITACQCFFYFDHTILALVLCRMLKPGGRLAVLYMAWLPFEDRIAGESEKLVLKYNPSWTGCGETRHPIAVPEIYRQNFELESSKVFDLQVPFTRESWNGRMKSCRGIGASLSVEETARFEQEHISMLEQIAPARFHILHYAAITVLKKK